MSACTTSIDQNTGDNSGASLDVHRMNSLGRLLLQNAIGGAVVGGDTEQTRIILGLLDSVARDGTQSQRRLAADLGIALGLINAYLKRCIKKGLVKTRQAPARRYVYYLTPQGLAEKSRLTVEYLSISFDFFRRAKEDCSAIFQTARGRGFNRFVLAGKSDLAEVAAICALDGDVEIVALVDAHADCNRFVGIPVVGNFDALAEEPDCVVVTDLVTTQQTFKTAAARFGSERVLVPQFLRLQVPSPQEHDA